MHHKSQLAYFKTKKHLSSVTPVLLSAAEKGPFQCRSELSYSQSMLQAPHGVPQQQRTLW